MLCPPPGDLPDPGIEPISLYVSCIGRWVLYYQHHPESPNKLSAAAAAKLLQSCPTLCDPMDCNPPGFSVHEDSPGKNTGVGFHAVLQGIFPTQGLNPSLLHCRHSLPAKLPRKPTSINIHGQISMWINVFISLGTYPGIYLAVESLGHM